jgi:hypothetical protein
MNHAMKSTKKKEKQHSKACEPAMLPLADVLVDSIVEFLK